MKIRVHIKGITPLLMHAFTEENYTSKHDKNALPREIAESYAYRHPETKELYIPAECIFACIMNGGKYHKLGKNKITTTRSSLIPAGVSMLQNYCNLGTKDFEVDIRSAVNNALGARIMVYRPRLDVWSTSFDIEIDTTMFSEKLIRQIIDDAGRKAGLLSFRPERKGYFGQFRVDNWETLEK